MTAAWTETRRHQAVLLVSPSADKADMTMACGWVWFDHRHPMWHFRHPPTATDPSGYEGVAVSMAEAKRIVEVRMGLRGQVEPRRQWRTLPRRKGLYLG